MTPGLENCLAKVKIFGITLLVSVIMQVFGNQILN
jgi:hypothetical protein